MKSFSVALVSDLLEENWPSMDLVSDMLYTHISARYPQECKVNRLRPPMRARFSGLKSTCKSTFARNADRLINRFFDYPAWLQKYKNSFDLFHLVDHSYAQLIHALPMGKAVVTCHDLDTFRCLLHPSLEPRSWQFRIMTKQILSGLAKARHVFCVSETVRQELLRLALLPPERVSVALNGVDPLFTPKTDPVADSEAASLIGPTEEPCLLSIGSTIPRKRIDLLLQVFSAIRKTRPLRLIRVGGPFTAAQETLVNTLGVRGSITTLPFVSRAVLAAVYRRVNLTLLISESEGFGLPLVESLACGCPVVASDLPVLREIGGQSVSLCPIGDIPAWSGTILDLLDEHNANPTASAKRRADGIDRASRFSWENSAIQYVTVYNKLLEQATDN